MLLRLLGYVKWKVVIDIMALVNVILISIFFIFFFYLIQSVFLFVEEIDEIDVDGCLPFALEMVIEVFAQCVVLSITMMLLLFYL